MKILRERAYPVRAALNTTRCTSERRDDHPRSGSREIWVPAVELVCVFFFFRSCSFSLWVPFVRVSVYLPAPSVRLFFFVWLVFCLFFSPLFSMLNYCFCCFRWGGICFFCLFVFCFFSPFLWLAFYFVFFLFRLSASHRRVPGVTRGR